MDYCIKFKGDLTLNQELNEDQMKYFQSILEESLITHPDGNIPAGEQISMDFDLELLDDNSGSQWNQFEKTYDTAEKINLVIKLMQKVAPGFSLEGWILEQGDIIDDRVLVIVKDGKAVKHDTVTVPKAARISCPQCNHEFEHPM